VNYQFFIERVGFSWTRSRRPVICCSWRIVDVRQLVNGAFLVSGGRRGTARRSEKVASATP